jgi:hypothetical protein
VRVIFLPEMQNDERQTSDQGIIREVEGCKVRHFRWTAVGVHSVGQELVDGVNGVGLNSIVSGEDYEHGDIGLP